MDHTTDRAWRITTTPRGGTVIYGPGQLTIDLEDYDRGELVTNDASPLRTLWRLPLVDGARLELTTAPNEESDDPWEHYFLYVGDEISWQVPAAFAQALLAWAQAGEEA